MKRKKGFTLIELLAVIVIIGLISVLIIPKVGTTIKDSRKKTYEVSSNALSRAASNYFLEQKAKAQGFKECSYDFTNNINTCAKFEFTGKKPDSGLLTIKSNGKVALAIQFDNYCFTKKYNSEEIKIKDYDENTCIIKDPSFEIVTQETPGTLTPGDEVAIKTEHFYVVSSNETETVLLAKYNLLVGKNFNNGDAASSEDILESTPGYGIQNSDAIGFISNDKPIKAVTEFSATTYWQEETTYPSEVYNQKDENGNYMSTVMNYVNEYKEYLEKQGAVINDARLLTYGEATEKGCVFDLPTFTCSAAPEWIYSTSFWLGTAYNNSTLWSIWSHSSFVNNYYNGIFLRLGVRPVIEVPTTEIIE